MLLLFILLSYSQIKLPIFRPILTFFLPFFPCFSFHRKILSDSRCFQGEEERSVSITNIRRIYKLVFQLLLRPSASFPFLHILRKRSKWQGTTRTVFPAMIFTVPWHSVYVLYNDEQEIRQKKKEQKKKG